MFVSSTNSPAQNNIFLHFTIQREPETHLGFSFFCTYPYRHTGITEKLHTWSRATTHVKFAIYTREVGQPYTLSFSSEHEYFARTPFYTDFLAVITSLPRLPPETPKTRQMQHLCVNWNFFFCVCLQHVSAFYLSAKTMGLYYQKFYGLYLFACERFRNFVCVKNNPYNL